MEKCPQYEMCTSLAPPYQGGAQKPVHPSILQKGGARAPVHPPSYGPERHEPFA